jgi:hypothetical protein
MKGVFAAMEPSATAVFLPWILVYQTGQIILILFSFGSCMQAHTAGHINPRSFS